MKPSVSIIVPAYNREGLITATLDSVLHQAYDPLELIVVDDGSKDRTAEIATMWMAQHPEMNGRVICLSRNQGKSEAVNTGIAVAGGEYLAILDSDDLLEPGAIGQQVHFLDGHPSCGMVFARARLLYENGVSDRIEGGGLSGESDDYVRDAGSLVTHVNPVVASSVLLRRSVVSRIGGLDQTWRIIHDWDYWIRVSRVSKIGFLNVPLVQYRVGSSNSLSTNRQGTFAEVMRYIAAQASGTPRGDRLMSVLRHTRYYVRESVQEGRIWDAIALLARGALGFLRVLFR